MSSAIREICKQHPSWPFVEYIIGQLVKAGHQAVLAGGGVRDAALGVKPKDLDVATSAKPEEVMAIFPDTVPVGAAFGVVLVKGQGQAIEVATFRSDGTYQDGRRPSSVKYSSLSEDAKRRDFTVNAMFYDLVKDRLIDEVGGLKDLNARVLRTVGEPLERFSEDHLRLMRAVRLATQLGFSIEEKTWQAVRILANKISLVARERVTDELRKMCCSSRQWLGWQALAQSGLLKVLWPNFTLASQMVNPLRLNAPSQLSLTLGWFAFVGEMAIDKQKLWLDELKLSRAEIKEVHSVVESFNQLLKGRRGEQMQVLDQSTGTWLLHLWPCAQTLKGQSDLLVIEEVVNAYRAMMDTEGHLPPPLVTGADLLKRGNIREKDFAVVLNKLYCAQLEEHLKVKSEVLARL